jgi:hypothetical protein
MPRELDHPHRQVPDRKQRQGAGQKNQKRQQRQQKVERKRGGGGESVVRQEAANRGGRDATNLRGRPLDMPPSMLDRIPGRHALKSATGISDLHRLPLDLTFRDHSRIAWLSERDF